MHPAKVVSIVAGALLLLVAVALIVSGAFLLWAHTTQRDSSGFYNTSSRVVSTNAYALTSPDLDVDLGGAAGKWIPTGGAAAVRIQATSSGATPLFVGIGPTDKVTQYLANVAHDEITNFRGWSDTISYTHVDGAASPQIPGQQAFWVAKQEGAGSQTLEWKAQSGSWTAVIMNSDASPQVNAAMSLGARFEALLVIGASLLGVGILGLVVAVVLIVVGARPARPTSTPHPPFSPGNTAVPQP